MDCKCLIHPFQNDPGTSQSQRVMDNLLSGAAKIDARTMADLLNFFVQMSRHINYYDLKLNLNDWQPFFKNSVPFTLASIIKFPLQITETNLALYKSIFDKKPSPVGLQLCAFSIYYRFINSINNWHLLLKDSSLPIAATLEELIMNKLQSPVKQFIQYSNAAVKTYGINRINFLKLSGNPVWGLDSSSLSAIDASFSTGTTSSRQRIINLYSDFSTLLTIFNDAVKTLSDASEKSLEGSFIPMKDELRKKHPPHLALLFAFLNMFRQLQNDLNQYTRKHLDYFYKEILLFKAEEAVPDKANIVFEIQKALKKYLIKKGLRVKDGKDNNRQDILFSLDDDIVVTQTTISDKRTLFLNNQLAHSQTYLEGVYIAPAADMADGVEKEFSGDPKNFPTMGAHYTKYINPETKFVKPYPNARIGFILASPVLSLQSGSTRHIHIDLSCTLMDSVCPDPGDSFLRATRIFQYVQNRINRRYVYVSEDKFKLALKKGFTKEFIGEIRTKFLSVKSTVKPCYSGTMQFEQEGSFFWYQWNNYINTLITDPIQRKILDEIFPKQKILNLSFSGEKEWIIPEADDYIITIDPLVAGNTFSLKIDTTLTPEKDSIVNYNKDILGEDYGTNQPLVKIQLNDKIKEKWDITPDPDADDPTGCCHQTDQCCLLYEPTKSKNIISYYHFFRNLIINKIDNSLPVIQVDVCGLKNFIVQNDESVMDVNSPIMAFGARPKVNSNFYIGSEEIFLKKWTNLWLNIKWKDLPADFDAYYSGYQNQFWDAGGAKWINDGLITKENFLVLFSILEDGKWYLKPGDISAKCSIDKNFYNKLFPDPPFDYDSCFNKDKSIFFENYSHQFHLTRNEFLNIPDPAKEKHIYQGIKKMDVDSRCCFLKITLKCQDFQHEKYPFVLARQMAAMGRLPDLIAGAVYFNIDPALGYQVLNLQEVFNDIKDSFFISDSTNIKVRDIQIEALMPLNTPSGHHPLNNTEKINFIKNIINTAIDVNFMPPPSPNLRHYNTLNDAVSGLQAILASLNDKVDKSANSGAVIPHEPYTPTISSIALDYSAKATIEDIDLIHLYPYQDTYKREEIQLQPPLFPTFCDEGNLFLGLQDLVPGDNLNILFQMAEATSDSESDKETVYWHYLDTNVWKPLRTGFEVLDDATKNLTSSGIIKLALPANMTNDNTVMPKGLHWIKATIPQNSGSVSETIGIFTQAIKVIFSNDEANDKLRLSVPLLSGSISKLEVADASVKTVSQPYDSFGGLIPEIEQQFYIRVSETLRHKGRAIQPFDYERLALQAFPQLFKAKCISHSFALNAHEYINDFPYAGGYVMLAVIPDLNKLKAGNSYEPKVPVSIIENIDAFIRQRTSPFVRFRAMNPRYEKINFCMKIRLLKGKDENYYKEQAKQDIRNFLAPWAVGDYYKLTFGQCVYRSDIIQFLETRDYMDFISDLRMAKEGDTPDITQPRICPDTPRSILIAGDIEVCIDKPDCEKWGDYYACPEDKNPVVTCDTKTEKITDYCKHKVQ